jgi:hypothetical protein
MTMLAVHFTNSTTLELEPTTFDQSGGAALMLRLMRKRPYDDEAYVLTRIMIPLDRLDEVLDAARQFTTEKR